MSIILSKCINDCFRIHWALGLCIKLCTQCTFHCKRRIPLSYYETQQLSLSEDTWCDGHDRDIPMWSFRNNSACNMLWIISGQHGDNISLRTMETASRLWRRLISWKHILTLSQQQTLLLLSSGNSFTYFVCNSSRLGPVDLQTNSKETVCSSLVFYYSFELIDFQLF